MRAVVSISLLILLPLAAGAALPDGMIEDMADLDRAYIPAWVHTRNEDPAKAAGALARARDQWREMRQIYADAPEGDRFWGQDLRRVTAQFERARALLEAGAISKAHEELGVVREVLLQIRVRHEVTYYLDELARVHDVVALVNETLHNRRPGSLDAGDLEALLHLRDAVVRRWSEVMTTPCDADLYAIEETQQDIIAGLEADLDAAIKTFSEAVDGTDRAQLKRSGLDLKPRLEALYEAFGDFQSTG